MVHPTSNPASNPASTGPSAPTSAWTPARASASTARRPWAAALALTVGVVLAAGTALLASPASADTRPPAGTPATVSADALPTWQVNGVVWSAVTVGNVVYATGSFSRARPPGTAAGSAKEVAASNIIAIDIRTGNRVPTFNHALNGQGLAITASPDGKAVYVGGDFTQVDGRVHKRIASFSLVTGNLRASFDTAVSGSVRSLTATNGIVFVGGSFATIDGLARLKLGAVTTASGTLTAWAPSADRAVTSMVVAPAGGRLIVGGHFTTLNGTPAYGMGALDTTTGHTLAWAANRTIQNAGDNGSITSLRTDGTLIYGSGYGFGPGANFEGTFALRPATGSIVWVNDCLGDTYDVRPIGTVLYAATHAHDCSPINGFPDIEPDIYHRGLAFTSYSSGLKNTGPDEYGNDFSAFEHSSLLHWFPAVAAGTYTGQSQGAWTVTGNGTYVVLGGEFPTVNGGAQQGLTRFAIASVAPNRRGPQATRAELQPTATPGRGRITVSWTSTWDYDNRTLSYKVFRDGGTAPITTLSKDTAFWSLPRMSYTDSGLARGSTHTYRVQAVDPFGNATTSLPSAPATVG
jgi:trimeric autotransporter adhesin